MYIKRSIVYNNYDLLYEEYIVKKKTLTKIAREYNVSVEGLRKHMYELGITSKLRK